MVGVLPELRDVFLEVFDVFSQLLTHRRERFAVVFAHVLPTDAIFPHFVDEVFEFHQAADVKSWGLPVFFFRDHGKGFNKRFLQVFETAQHAAHVLDFLVVSDLFDDVCEFFVPFFFGGTNDAFDFFLVIAELKHRNCTAVIVRAYCNVL